MENNSTIVLLGGEARSCLAATRALGRKGHRVVVCTEQNNCLAAKSKYCHSSLNYPDPVAYKNEFQNWLEKIIAAEKPDYLIPVTDVTLEATLEIEQRLISNTAIPGISYDLFREVSDKDNLLRIAKSLGLNVPATLDLEKASQSEIENFSYPAVLKPKSTAAAGRARKIHYPKSAKEVEELASDKSNLILQEKIVGSGVGVFALCKNGDVSSLFCHRRLLEKPPTGGVSVLSESISPEDAPAVEASILLKDLKWNGIAMVEFKKHHDEKYYLMEINPRFWGSLELAIFSGVDFPSLLIEENPKPLGSYKCGLRLRWLLGTLDHLIIKIRNDGLSVILKILSANYLRFSLSSKTKFDVLDLSDLKPFLFELKNWFSRSA